MKLSVRGGRFVAEESVRLTKAQRSAYAWLTRRWGSKRVMAEVEAVVGDAGKSLSEAFVFVIGVNAINRLCRAETLLYDMAHVDMSEEGFDGHTSKSWRAARKAFREGVGAHPGHAAIDWKSFDAMFDAAERNDAAGVRRHAKAIGWLEDPSTAEVEAAGGAS